MKTIFNKIWNVITSEWNIFRVGLTMQSSVSKEDNVYLYDFDDSTDDLCTGNSDDSTTSTLSSGIDIMDSNSMWDSPAVNPASGLPMTGGMSDVGGNPSGSNNMWD